MSSTAPLAPSSSPTGLGPDRPMGEQAPRRARRARRPRRSVALIPDGCSEDDFDEEGRPSPSPWARGERWLRVDPDVLTALAEEITSLSALVGAQTHRLLALIAEFDRLEGWKREGFGSCAEWLAYRAHLDKVTAREKVRVARALRELPLTSAAMARGELSWSKVRAITRAADAESEEELLLHALSLTASQLERLARAWKRLGRADEEELERRLHSSRSFSVFPDDGGGYRVVGRLEPEVGALLMRAIEAAGDALYRGSVPGAEPPQRRADALALLVERALAAGLGGTWGARRQEAGADEGEEVEGSTVGSIEAEERTAAGASAEPLARASAEEGGGGEAVGATPQSETPADDPGSRPRRTSGARRTAASAEAACACASAATPSERYLVVLYVDEAVLAGRKDTASGGERTSGTVGPHLEDGTRISAEAARRLACDASVVTLRRSPDGTRVEVEGKRRTVSPRLRRALEIRDRGCRFPGCGCRFTEPHHIVPWALGGRTRLDNLCLLCATHHRLLHHGRFRVERDPERGHPVFYSPEGFRIPETPPRPSLHGVPLPRKRASGVGGVGAGEMLPAPVDGGRASAGLRRPPRWEEDVPLAFYLRALRTLA